MNHPVPHEPPADEDAGIGLPVFRTWRGVYVFVLGFFVGLVVLLAVFSRVFS